MVYLFAGASRRGDIRQQLQGLAHGKFHLELTELDLEIHHSHDLSKTELWDKLFQDIDKGLVDVLLLSPPCNTFSRARHHFRQGGPRPLRSAAWPLGFPWLRVQDQEVVQTANFFIFQCMEAAKRMHAKQKFFWWEHPEDLGKTKAGDLPASIWQLQGLRELVETTGASSWAIHQCIFGAMTSKPTRLISNLPNCLQHGVHWPVFDDGGFYSGPLGACPHDAHPPLLGFNVELQKWNTADSAAYPEGMCKAIALDIISALQSCMAAQGEHATPATPVTCHESSGAARSTTTERPKVTGKDNSGHTDEILISSEEELAETNEQQEDVRFDGKTSACFGQPIICRYEGCKKEFTDGFGLCSPGRWTPGARNRTASSKAVKHAEQVSELLHEFLLKEMGDLRRESFRLALGHYDKSPFGSEQLQSLRKKVAALLRPGGEGPLLECPARQPFFLHLLAESLKELDDPDWEILVQGDECFAKGVPVGVEEELPRTPQVFRRREKFRQLDITDFQPDMRNYATAELSSEELEAHFKKDELLGRMVPTTVAEAKMEYGEDAVLIAAMGAIQKPDGSVRPLHDGTHGIGLNNKIRILDRLEVPGPEEIIELVALAAESQEAAFCLSADISQAHRCVLIRKADWARLACRSSSESRTLWLNCVGTFGVSSAAYWWTRLFACVGRWVLRILGERPSMQVAYVDDVHLLCLGPRKFEILWMSVLAYELMGTPFAYHKFRGGLNVEYVGYQLEYDRQVAGISGKRAEWVINWISEAEKNGWMVQGRAFIEFTGRMSFIARVVTWIKPFLAPLFAWSSVLARGTVTRVPTLVFIALKFLHQQLQHHGHWVNVLAPWQSPKESFRTDAKCENGRIVLAGWSMRSGEEELKKVPWFCVEIFPSDLPMFFKENGDSQWCSTAAELLASYAAAYAFGYLRGEGVARNLKMAITGGTDNKSNQGLQSKNMSTKWPLLAVHMQVSAELLSHGIRMKLRWRPREQNVPADSLTNQDFSLFEISNRVHVTLSDLPLELLKELCASREEFLEAREGQANLRLLEGRQTKRQKMAAKTVW